MIFSVGETGGVSPIDVSGYNIIMRAGIGLLSVLIVLGIIMFVMFSGPGGGYVPAVVQAGNTAKSQANQMAGKDENDIRALDSIALEEDMSGNRLKGLLVKNILPGGPMQTVYGLAIGDEITGTIELNFKGDSDSELDKSLVFTAFQENKPLIILRNGEEMKLTPNSAITAAHPNMFGAPGASPTGQVQNVPTH